MSHWLKAATAPVRLPLELLVAMPEVVREVPGTVRDLRRLLGDLARLATEDGELSELLRETASLARRSGREVPVASRASGPRSSRARR